jgi:hypothetical protein
MAVPGFPSLFFLYGPNTNTSDDSIIIYLEAQAAYIRQALERVRAGRHARVEVRAEVEAASDRELHSTPMSMCSRRNRCLRGMKRRALLGGRQAGRGQIGPQGRRTGERLHPLPGGGHGLGHRATPQAGGVRALGVHPEQALHRVAGRNPQRQL